MSLQLQQSLQHLTIPPALVSPMVSPNQPTIQTLDRDEPEPELSEEAKRFASRSRAENTRRAYRSDWQDFTTWCDANDVNPLPAPPQTICNYITHLAGACKVATIRRRLSSIAKAHKVANYPSPTNTELVETVMSGIRREIGVAQEHKSAATGDLIGRMIDSLGASQARSNSNKSACKILAARDRALLTVGFYGAFRRSELVALTMDDVRFLSRGMVINIRRSKTDQEGEGREFGIEHQPDPARCPVKSLKAWIKLAPILGGPLFRPISRHGQIGDEALSAYGVALVVKRAAQSAGLDPQEFAGHSLRRGFVTSAAKAGVPNREISTITGHKTDAMINLYIEHLNVWENNPTGKIRI